MKNNNIAVWYGTDAMTVYAVVDNGDGVKELLNAPFMFDPHAAYDAVMALAEKKVKWPENN